ncbi:MAG: hypothetical protein B7X08_06215 [Acidocella sp. 20-63-7]|nr:MAG: hypothetical protein B7X08_06215 [Acidocella sp. 20-63-7]
MISRRTALALPLALLAEPAFIPPARAAARPLAVVMNSGEASISVIDMRARRVVQTLPTYREPSHWCLTPDRKDLYVCDASGNAIFAFNPQTAAPLGHRRIADPYQLAFTPDAKYLVVNALRINHVDIYDGNTLALVKRFAPGSMPSHLDFSPDSRASFNSCQGSDTLVSFDLVNMTTRWKSRVGRTPAGVLWHNGRILVCLMGENCVLEVDPETGVPGQRVVTGRGAHNLFLSPDGGTLYVSNRIGGTLSALDPATLKVRRTYTLPGGPDDMGIAPDGQLWIALRFAEAVAVMDPESGKYMTIPVGRSPHGIFLNTELAKPGKLTAERL